MKKRLFLLITLLIVIVGSIIILTACNTPDDAFIIYDNGVLVSVEHSKVKAKVEIPDRVTSIGEEAFKNDSKIKELTIGNNVKEIGARAFEGCSNLKKVTINGNDKHIDYRAFFNCEKLKTIIFNGSNTRMEEEVFEGTEWDDRTEGIQYIGDVVYGYNGQVSSANKVSLRNGVASIASGAFRNCYNLVRLDIPSSVTHIGKNAFAGCIKLVQISNHSSVPINSPAKIGGEVSNSDQFENEIYENNGIIILKINNKQYAIGATGNRQNLYFPSKITDIYPYAFYGYSDITLNISSNPNLIIHTDALNGCHYAIKGKNKYWEQCEKEINWDRGGTCTKLDLK